MTKEIETPAFARAIVLLEAAEHRLNEAAVKVDLLKLKIERIRKSVENRFPTEYERYTKKKNKP